jgi:HK97 family phage portal protein
MAFLDVLGWPRPPEEVREKRAPVYSLEAKDSSFLNILNANGTALPIVTIETALTVPAVLCAVAFLPRTLAALPLHAFRKTADGPEKISGGLEIIVHEAPNAEWTSFKLRQHFWQQVFTGGRGLLWIERAGTSIAGLWPINPANVEIKRDALGRTTYKVDSKIYPASDIIDVPFMLKADGLGHYGPVVMGTKAIQLALAMNDYGSQFFAGGGVPPLAVFGPMPAGAEAMKRAVADINRSIAQAKTDNTNIINMPPGYELKPIGFDPDKGQMTDGRRFQIEEIARIFQLPPVFLQDLTHGTFSNTEQQDLHLVKHLIGQWAEAFEEEMNLKLFGQKNGGRYVEHNLDGLMRGDFVTRMNGLGQAVQNALLTPDEARTLENRPAKGGNADKLFIQGATIPLDSSGEEVETEEPTALADGLAEGLADE